MLPWLQILHVPSNHARYNHTHNLPHIEHVEQLSQPFVKHVTAGNGEVYSV